MRLVDALTNSLLVQLLQELRSCENATLFAHFMLEQEITNMPGWVPRVNYSVHWAPATADEIGSIGRIRVRLFDVVDPDNVPVDYLICGMTNDTTDAEIEFAVKGRAAQ